jgi:abequosyltransferase
VCIPTYNFGGFIGETLDSIVRQATEEVEIVVLDGGSTDNTTEVVEGFRRAFPRLRYYRQDFKGGIDRDMAKSVELARGEYCWLFSADDLMADGALLKMLDQVRGGADVYLCGFMLCTFAMEPMKQHPVFHLAEETEFELGRIADRERFFSLAQTTTAFFSFMSSLVVRKSRWDIAPFDDSYYGSCWAHVARLFGMIPNGLRVRFLPETYLLKRDDNDSFSERGMARRVGIAIEGYHRLADDFFGQESMEARHIRRVMKNEYYLRDLLYIKLKTSETHIPGDMEYLDGLVAKLFADGPAADRLRLLLFRMAPFPALRLAEKISRFSRKFSPLRRRS